MQTKKAQVLIEKLIKKGYSIESIASILDVSFSTIWRWKEGKKPSHHIFIKSLEELLEVKKGKLY